MKVTDAVRSLAPSSDKSRQSRVLAAVPVVLQYGTAGQLDIGTKPCMKLEARVMLLLVTGRVILLQTRVQTHLRVLRCQSDLKFLPFCPRVSQTFSCTKTAQIGRVNRDTVRLTLNKPSHTSPRGLTMTLGEHRRIWLLF